MPETYGSGIRDASIAAVRRYVLRVAPGAPHPAVGGQPLDATVITAAESPAVIQAERIERGPFRARSITPAAASGFSAFLDGIQRAEVAKFAHGMYPIVVGLVAAVVRERIERRMRTWRHAVETRVYAPATLVPEIVSGDPDAPAIVDTLDFERGGDPPSDPQTVPHPQAIVERAIHLIQRDRETLEHSLAAQWVGERRLPLFVDGGISGSLSVATSDSAIGVVKTHRSLYQAGPDDLGGALSLAPGERSPVLRITSPRRASVASWYLRLHDHAGRDPAWGLVRLEISDPRAAAPGRSSITDRADEISGWLLAERLPVSLPDRRWDRMIYGVRDCEEFLRAVT